MRVPGLLLALFWVVPAVAQVPPPAPPDTTQRDTTDVTGVLLRSTEDIKVRLPVMPRAGRERLYPAAALIVLTRDSLDFMNAETMGDVLAQVAGVHLLRGGWLGRPELPNYRGRGATSVEYFLDGVPYTPMGQDSLAVDASLLPIGFLERVEIEPLPGLLRVHMFLREHGVLAPWSKLTIARGQYDQGRYEGLLQKRSTSGFGYSVGAAYWISPGFNDSQGDFDVAYGWLEGSYVPNDRAGFRLRYRLTSPNRDAGTDALAEEADTLSLPVQGGRSDIEARLTLRSSGDVLGNRTDVVVSRSTWALDSLAQDLWRGGITALRRSQTGSLEAGLWLSNRWTRLDARVRGGWAVSPLLSASLEGAVQLHEEGRRSAWATGRASLDLPLGLSASGAYRFGRGVERPAFREDTAQQLSNGEVSLGWDTSRLGARVGYARLGAFQPVGFRQFVVADSLAPTGKTEWVTVSARLAPRQWFTIQGWYSHPIGTVPDAAPPHRSLVTAAIRSKFLRTFPSGIFDLKIAVSMESWGGGILGRIPGQTGEDPDEVVEPMVVPLAGATFLRALIQMEFSGFIIYYDRANLLDSDSTYIPGFRLPIQAATFGVRWAFHN